MLEAIFSIFTKFDFAAFPAAFFSLFDFSTYTLFTWAAFVLTVIGMVLSLPVEPDNVCAHLCVQQTPYQALLHNPSPHSKSYFD